MYLRIFKINLLVILISFAFGCKTSSYSNDYLIISTIYNNIPKYIPAPPNNLGKIDSTKGIRHKYAINENLINEKINSNIFFYKYKSEKLFDKIKLSIKEYDLVKKLNEDYPSFKMSHGKLKEYLNKDLVILNKKVIDAEDENKNDINRILTFSKPLYNNEMDAAILYVINYGSGLDSSQVIYLLKKNKDIWEIKYYKTISIS